MQNTIATIKDLLAQIEDASGDKPQTHYLARILRDQAADLVRQSQPGLGEFKWTAKAVKALTMPALGRYDKPTIIVARSETTPGETWHTDGHYLKLGAVPKRFGDVNEQVLPMSSVAHVVTDAADGDDVTVTGGQDLNGVDCVNLSNGTPVNRLLLAYVVDGFTDVTLTSKGPKYPVCVHQSGVIVGLVMPVNPN